MKKIILLILLFSFKIINAQRICLLDEQFGLLYIDSKTKVRIETRYLPPSAYAGTGGIEEFIMVNDIIKSRAYNFDDSLSDNDEYDSSLYGYYPSLVKVRNNFFEIQKNDRDSMIIDDKKRIIEGYSSLSLSNSFGAKDKYVYKFNYINDTTVLEIVIPPQGKFAALSLYYMDLKHNLKAVKETDIDKSLLTDKVDISKTNFSTATWFNYDKIRKRILSIEYFELNAGNKKQKLLRIHYFVYKNGKPIKSYVVNTKTKAREYQQLYKYSLIK